MPINSTEVSYGFGQMGSGHIKASTALYPPAGKVIVAITMLEDVQFLASTGLVGDTTGVASGSASVDDGVSFMGTGTQFLANGMDDDGDKCKIFDTYDEFINSIKRKEMMDEKELPF